MRLLFWFLYLLLIFYKIHDSYDYKIVDPVGILEIDPKEDYISSIEEIADVDWAIKNMPDYEVSTKEQLAGIVYVVNSGMCDDYVTITLMNDIDLADLNWEPMGNNDVAFSGKIDGNGYTIRNMMIPDYGEYYASFIGYTCNCTIEDISFIDANVNGGMMAGIVGGQVIGSTVWRNVYVSGEINTTANEIGAILAWQAHMSLVDCSSDVLVNGKEYKYASYQQMVRMTTPVDETFRIIDRTGIVVRDHHDGYTNLMWHVDVNGIEVLERGAEGELEFDIHQYVMASKGDKCTVYLVAWTGETYTRVSNIVQIDY